VPGGRGDQTRVAVFGVLLVAAFAVAWALGAGLRPDAGPAVQGAPGPDPAHGSAVSPTPSAGTEPPDTGLPIEAGTTLDVLPDSPATATLPPNNVATVTDPAGTPGGPVIAVPPGRPRPDSHTHDVTATKVSPSADSPMPAAAMLQAPASPSTGAGIPAAPASPPAADLPPGAAGPSGSPDGNGAPSAQPGAAPASPGNPGAGQDNPTGSQSSSGTPADHLGNAEGPPHPRAQPPGRPGKGGPTSGGDHGATGRNSGRNTTHK
jgi:hypothetical protein